MKKTVWIMVTALALALAFAACKEPEPEHVHQWEWTEDPSATCTTTGVEKGVCKLDQSHTTTREIAALGHDWEWTEDPPATCTATGVDKGVCKHDQSHATTRETAKIAHTFAAGTYLCSVCNNPGELGDTGPGGGKIFYRIEPGFTMTDDNTTAHYLEAAPARMATTLAWASSAFLPPDRGGTGSWTDIVGTATAIGTGRKNTALILATDANAPAAKACNDYSNGGKTDWFLPSRDELNEFPGLPFAGITPGYWSSSQSSSSSTYIGIGASTSKNATNYVQAVRAF